MEPTGDQLPLWAQGAVRGDGTTETTDIGALPMSLDATLDATLAAPEVDEELRQALAQHKAPLTPDEEKHLVGMLSERNARWLRENADAITMDEFSVVLGDFKKQVETMADNLVDADATHLQRLQRYLWSEHRILFGSEGDFYRVRAEPPPYLLFFHGLTTPEASTTGLRRVLPPPIAPAFLYSGHQGLGRISSSQVNLAIYTACVAPKAEWEETSKGFPRYTFRVPSGDIAITLSPDVAVQKDLPQQVAAMHQLRDELSVEDWDVMTALMAQVLAVGRPDASAFVTADAVLDNRKVERKKSGGYSSGHHPKMRTKISESINRLAHLRVRTETLQIRELAPDGSVRWVPADWNERVLQIQGDWTRGDTGAVLGWRYNFGASFTTFLARPNRYVGYLLQETLALHVSKQQTAKQLAHYLALHLRIDARNGRGLDRRLGELLDGAKIPSDPQRQQRTIDRLEGALRDLVKAGLIRIEWNGRVLDATSPDVDTWSAMPPHLRGRRLLDAYVNQKIVIRAEADIEQRYDREIRRRPRDARDAPTPDDL